MEKIKLWFNICRPRTLLASICPVIIGLMYSLWSPSCEDALSWEDFSWGIALATLFCALSLQILANLINDYYDFVKGSDKAGRVGPKRALAEGIVSISQMKKAIKIVFLIVIGLGMILVLRGTWVILGIGVLSMLFAWLYTATRHSLSYTGMADIICFLFYGPLATMGTTWLQTGEFSYVSFVAGFSCGCISVMVLATNNLRDLEDDAQVGKKTFPVRYGKRATLVALSLLMMASAASSVVAVHDIIMMIILVPELAVWLQIKKAQGKTYNLCLWRAGLINLFYVGITFVVIVLKGSGVI